MSNESANIYHLLNGMLYGGLPFVASFLEKVTKRAVIITDSIGRIHYPDIPGTPVSLDELFIQLPPDLKEDEYHYADIDECLYCRIGQDRASAYIIIRNLPSGEVSQTASLCSSEIKLAIKYYFCDLEKMRETQVAFKKELAEYLLFKSNANIRDIIKLSQRDLDIDKPYLVTITEADETENEIDWDLISSHTSQHLKRINLEIIPIAWTNCLLSIFPASFKNDTLEIDPEWAKQIFMNSFKFKDIIGKITGKTISIGIGKVYPLSDLHKSYTEARTAITLPRLMGEKSFVQRYSDLGAFSFVLSQDISSLKDYCDKTLGTLIEYDDKTERELLPTLRTILDNNLNWKYSADSLYIHVNTLHYRMQRIEQLLNVDLSKMYTQVNLFIAVKVWDSLKLNGYFD